MSKRLDILGARIFGASICHARKYLQPFQKCPNVWTKSPDLAIMHKHKLHIIRIKTCICAFCYFINFLHTFLDIFNLFNPHRTRNFCGFSTISILRPHRSIVDCCRGTLLYTVYTPGHFHFVDKKILILSAFPPPIHSLSSTYPHFGDNLWKSRGIRSG